MASTRVLNRDLPTVGSTTLIEKTRRENCPVPSPTLLAPPGKYGSPPNWPTLSPGLPAAGRAQRASLNPTPPVMRVS